MVSGRVVITGATGFIGGRLVELLAADQRARVRVLLRDFRAAARVARFPAEMIKIDLSDPEAVSGVIAAGDLVVHAAFDWADMEFNERAAHCLASACLSRGADRLVHVSTFSVYGPLPVGMLDERGVVGACGSPYAAAKIRIEDDLMAMHSAEGLPVTIVQPTCVYGPFGDAWTVSQLEKLRRGRVVLPDEGQGLCNSVYIDDVATAILRAAEVPEAVGKKFLISGSEAVTWRRFFECYESMLGVRALKYMDGKEIEKLIDAGSPIAVARRIGRDPHRVLDFQWARALYRIVTRTIGEQRWSRLRRVIPPHVFLPDHERLEIFRSRTVVSIDRARTVLAWEPRYDIDSGMERTRRFVNWARL